MFLHKSLLWFPNSRTLVLLMIDRWPGLQTLETDIDAFRAVINYRRYRIKNRGAYIDPNADLSLQKVK